MTKWCANYDKKYGCLPLDCECYMLGKCWTGAYCRYFREAVLPLDPVLEAALTAALTSAGAPPAEALSAVLIFRLVSFWLPIPFSAFSLQRLRRKGVI